MEQDIKQNEVVKRINDTAKFTKYNKMHITKIGQGSAEGEMQITDNSLNHFGTVHGGALFSLADNVAGVAAASRGTACVTLNANINYFRASSLGIIKAAAHEISRTNKTGLYEVELIDEEGLVAKAMYTYYDTGKTLSGKSGSK